VKYDFIMQQSQRGKLPHYPVRELCRVMDVSSSGYYTWCDRGESQHTLDDDRLLEDIRRIHDQGRGTYGSPKIWHQLIELGQRHSRKRVARLMAENGLFGRKRKRFVVTTTTKANPAHQPAPNVLNREFHADGPNQKWLSDITQIPTDEGDVYLAVTLDLFSRMAVGWAMDDHMEATLTRSAFDMAVLRRQPDPGLLHHSDRGSQYTDGGFRSDLREQACIESMSRKGDVWDNAPMESFFAQLEIELLQRRHFKTRTQALQEVFEYIEVFYNRIRIHSSLGYLSPAEFEARYVTKETV
jgi:putative transposase